jgi:hypothetical protein
MAWPLSQDYNEAIQSPHTSFADPELRAGVAAVNALGLPLPCSGNFADVYKFTCPATGRTWAVKCFTRQIQGLRERYFRIAQHLRQFRLPFMVEFTLLDQGIRVRGNWYPALKMQWVEGVPLNQFVTLCLDKPPLLDTLSQLWVKLAGRMHEASFAHGDLQHGNVLLVPGGRADSLSVKLVDYDGMCVPALSLLKANEVGHPAYQHPQRLREATYNLEVDCFSHLVIYTALRGLMAGGAAAVGPLRQQRQPALPPARLPGAGRLAAVPGVGPRERPRGAAAGGGVEPGGAGANGPRAAVGGPRGGPAAYPLTRPSETGASLLTCPGGPGDANPGGGCGDRGVC